LSKEEVRKLIFSCTNLKHRTLLLTVYSAGLRVSEVVKLELSHIERSRQMLRVEQGKGIHKLRHCFATHLLEHGTSTIEIKRLMGHSSIRTTAKYLHVTNEAISKIISPLDMVIQ
jgi:site-specific recombinase XerD